MAKHPFRLNEKTVLLTGSNTTVGRSIALKLSEYGASVGLVDSNVSKTEKLAELIMDQHDIQSERGKAVAIACDVTKPHHVADAVRKAAESFGGVDIYIDAMMISRKQSFLDPEALNDFERAIDINLKAPILLTHEVLKFLKGRRNARILYLLQDLSLTGEDGEAVTAATRTSLISFAKGLARELSTSQVTVNCASLSPTEEYLLERDSTNPSIQLAYQQLLKVVPSAKIANPEDIAEAISFLVSAQASSITGQVLKI